LRQTLLTEFRQVFEAVRSGSYPYRSRKPKPRAWASYDRAQMCEAPDMISLIGGVADEASVRIQGCRPCWNAYPKPLLAKLILTQQYDGRCNRVGVGLLRLFRERLRVDAAHAGLSYKTLERNTPSFDGVLQIRALQTEVSLRSHCWLQATLLKYEERLPLRKAKAALQRQSLTVTPSTVQEIISRVAYWLRPEYDRIQQRIRHAETVYTDETGIKVDGKQHWIWAFTTDSETLVAIRRSRGKKVLTEILGEDFKGTLVCDGWKSYPNFTSRIQRCWAHLLREAKYLAERIDEAKPLSEALHKLYSRLNTSPEDKPPPKEATRLVKAAKRTMAHWATTAYKTDEVRRFAAKIRNGIDHWFTFTTTPGVEPTNNRAERALREHVVQRKIIGTLRNQKGTFSHETITTLLATWKQ